MLATGRSRSEWGQELYIHLAGAYEKPTGREMLQRTSCPELHRAHYIFTASTSITLFKKILFSPIHAVMIKMQCGIIIALCEPVVVFLRTVKQK